MTNLIETVALALDPVAWDDAKWLITRADVEQMHSRRQASINVATLVLRAIEAAGKKVVPVNDAPSISAQARKDGVWLTFTTQKGLSAHINMSVGNKLDLLSGSTHVIQNAINQWHNEVLAAAPKVVP